MKSNQLVTGTRTAISLGAGVLLAAGVCNLSHGFERYYNTAGDDGSNCSECHGKFTEGVSPKGTVFPSNNKHEMHRASGNMATACNLCHTSGDGRNPFIAASTGTASNTGLGCTGCHEAPGLRAHHLANGVASCLDCHARETAPAENVKPPYYGTVDTKANNPGNTVQVANTNENWSLGDFLGLDNDGNNLYDLADYAIGPYRLLSAAKEGNNLRVTWLTAGGRTNRVQAASSVTGTYSDVSAAISIPGVGLVTTNFLEIGGATNAARFYRLRAAVP